MIYDRAGRVVKRLNPLPVQGIAGGRLPAVSAYVRFFPGSLNCMAPKNV